MGFTLVGAAIGGGLGIGGSLAAGAMAGASLGSSVAQVVAGHDAAKAQQQQAQVAQQQLQVQQQQAEMANIRSVRQQVRAARAARAAVVNRAAIGGVSTSSGAIGGAGAITTGMAGELDYFGKARDLQSQDFALQQTMGNLSARIGKAQATQATAGALGSLAGTIFEAKGGWKTIFGGNEPTQNKPSGA